MKKQQLTSDTQLECQKHRHGHSPTMIETSNNLVTLSYPYSVELDLHLLQQQDELITNIYHQYHPRLPRVMILLDGVSDLSTDSWNYIQSYPHQKLYQSVAYVLSKGNMSVLERHYLEQLFINRTQKPTESTNLNYPIGIFTTVKQAIRWLGSYPKSNHIN
ncbi:hypothetical protein DZA50_02150 [Kangiella sp. HD9-110m-PIT-SAG07]|nr:hypothetical protein DZA50_02150 [Kangiella sp. HD9-110m-PIT-SAG07]